MIPGNSFKCFAILSTLSFLISLISCDPNKKFKEKEEEEKLLIQNYLAENDTLHFELKASGLYYLDIEVGTGLQAQTHDTAFMFYSMHSLSGELMETNEGTDDTLIIAVNESQVSVKGFDEGVTYMREGGKAMFLVPSSLAFGPYGTYYIPGYTPLLFDVELVKLVKFSAR
jgi:peptidylprolyl isomerase